MHEWREEQIRGRREVRSVGQLDGRLGRTKSKHQKHMWNRLIRVILLYFSVNILAEKNVASLVMNITLFIYIYSSHK